MNPLVIAALAVAAFVVSVWFTRQFCNPDSIVYVLDHPSDRSLHVRPVPRGGGMAILTAIIVFGATAFLFYPARGLAGIASGILIVGTVSFLDDRYSIQPLYRLVAHATAAAVILYSGFFLQSFEMPGATWSWPYAVGTSFSLLFVVWMANLYNFMDGMDGFAGGMAMFGFGTFAVMGWMAGQNLFLVVNLIIASASAGFLVFNFPPARIFMGDVVRHPHPGYSRPGRTRIVCARSAGKTSAWRFPAPLAPALRSPASLGYRPNTSLYWAFEPLVLTRPGHPWPGVRDSLPRRSPTGPFPVSASPPVEGEGVCHGDPSARATTHSFFDRGVFLPCR